MPTLELSPDEDGYSFPEPVAALSVQTEGGLPRTRKDIISPNKFVTVQWSCGIDEYDYLCGFNSANIANNSEAFDISLFIDEVSAKTYSAMMVPETFGLRSQEGETYIVGATLEIFVTPEVSAETVDGSASNAGVGTGGAGYYPGSVYVPPSVDYETWDFWHFETVGASQLGENANEITIYNDDSQSVSSTFFSNGAKSLRKGGGSPVENTPELPEAAKWEIEFNFYFPAVISSSTGYLLRVSSFNDYCSFDVDSGSQVLLFNGDAGTSVIVSTGTWHSLKWRVTATNREWYIDDVLCKTDSRASLGIGATFTVSWQIGRGGYDYYYGSYVYIDELRCGAEGLV